jgi:hypothetical protein
MNPKYATTIPASSGKGTTMHLKEKIQIKRWLTAFATLVLATTILVRNSSAGPQAVDHASADEASANYVRAAFREVEVEARIQGSSLVLVVKNRGTKDLLIANDFCFDPNVTNEIFELPKLQPVSGAFSSGISHLQRGMAKLPSKGERTCGIPYSKLGTEQSNQPRRGVVLWQTDLFVGELGGNYSSLSFAGAIPVTLPIGTSDDIDPPVNSAALIRFKGRHLFEIID